MLRMIRSLTVREIKIKTTVKYHLTSVKMAIINKSTNNKYHPYVHCSIIYNSRGWGSVTGVSMATGQKQ